MTYPQNYNGLKMKMYSHLYGHSIRTFVQKCVKKCLGPHHLPIQPQLLQHNAYSPPYQIIE